MKAGSIALGIMVAATIAAGAEGTEARQGSQHLQPLPYEGKENVLSIVPRLDVLCILRSWRLKGIMVCPTPSGGINVCLRVENAWPTGLLEVVRQPMRSHLAEMKPIFESLKPILVRGGTSSSHAPVAGAGSAGQFAEAHVYSFVPQLPLISALGIPLAIPQAVPFGLSYLSELDRFAWRNSGVDKIVTSGRSRLGRLRACGRIPDPQGCAGTWGSYSPRIGFIVHPSQVMAAHMQGLRAGRAASSPLGRVVLSPYPYEPRTGHYIQSLSPVTRSCMPIGSPLVKAIESGAGSKHGAYLFLHFGIFEECRGCLPLHLEGPRSPF